MAVVYSHDIVTSAALSREQSDIHISVLTRHMRGDNFLQILEVKDLGYDVVQAGDWLEL